MNHESHPHTIEIIYAENRKQAKQEDIQNRQYGNTIIHEMTSCKKSGTDKSCQNKIMAVKDLLKEITSAENLLRGRLYEHAQVDQNHSEGIHISQTEFDISMQVCDEDAGSIHPKTKQNTQQELRPVIASQLLPNGLIDGAVLWKEEPEQAHKPHTKRQQIVCTCQRNRAHHGQQQIAVDAAPQHHRYNGRILDDNHDSSHHTYDNAAQNLSSE